jgi:heterodisulfide reductase subunit C
MELKSVIFIIVLLSAFVIFGWSFMQMVRMISIGKPEKRMDNLFRRFRKTMAVAIGQSKLFREPVAGIMHGFIFWGFLVLLTSVLEAIIDGIVPGFSFRFLGAFYVPLAFLQDLFTGMVIIGVCTALIRRFIIRPKRLQVDRHASIDAAAILTAIFVIMITLLGQNAARMQANDIGGPHFLSGLLGSILTSSDASINSTLFESYWWIHIVLILGFLNYLPYSKHAHVLTSIPNVFLTSLQPKGSLKPVDFEAEGVDKFGASDVEDLTWKQLLDGFTCTECGRCSASCPANATGKSLSPKKIMTDIRHRTAEKGKFILKNKKHAERKEDDKKLLENSLLHNYITKEELFACTTCMACMQECPVNNEHVHAIIDLRRSLVLMESSFPPEVQVVFKNLETNFSPWAFPSSGRMDWAEGMGVPQMSQVRETDLRFWVGCAGAFDSRYIKGKMHGRFGSPDRE